MGLNVFGSKSLFWKTGVDNTGLKKGSKQSAGILAGLASKVSKMDVFAALGASAVLAFKKITKEAYKFSKRFESAMKEVQTISLAVQKDYDGVSTSIMNLSKTVPDAADKLTKAYYQIVSAGYDGAEGLDLLTASSKLAVAGVADTFAAADVLTSIMNAYGDSAGTAMEISDKLFTTVKLGKVTLSQLSTSLSAVTGLAAQAGVSFNTLVGMVAKGTKTMQPKKMIVGITGILNALIKEPQDAAKKVISELGLEFDLATIKSKGFSTFLSDIMEKTGGNIKTLQKLFPNVRGLAGILAVATKSGGRFADVLKEMDNSAGATEEAFRIMINSHENQIKLFHNIVQAKLKPLGDNIMNHINNIAKGFNNAMTGYVAGFESYMSKLKAFESKGADLDKFIEEYETLKKKQTLSADEQERLNTLVSNIEKIVPGAVSAYDDYGKAIAINTENARMLFNIELNRIRISKEGSKAIKNYVKELRKVDVSLKQVSADEEGYRIALENSKTALDELLEFKKGGLKTISAESEEYKKLSDSTKNYLTFSGMVTEMDERHTTLLAMNGKQYKNLDDAIHSASDAFAEYSDKTEIASTNFDTYVLGLGKYVDTSKDAVAIAKDFQLYMGMGGTEALRYAEHLKELVTVKKKLDEDDDGSDDGDEEVITEKEKLEEMERLRSNYYNSVKFLDEGYYNYRVSMMNLDVAAYKTALGAEFDEKLYIKEQMKILDDEFFEAHFCSYEEYLLRQKELEESYNNLMISMITELNGSEYEQKRAHYADLSDALTEARERDLITEEEYQEKKKELQLEGAEITLTEVGNFSNALMNLSDGVANYQIQNLQNKQAKEIEDVQKSSLSEETKQAKIANIKEKYAAKEKALKQAQKPIMIAEAIVNTALGVTKALGSTIPPFNIILAAMVGALGAVEVATISAAQYNKGGEVDWSSIKHLSDGGELNIGSNLNKDSVPTLLTKKEIVINRESAQQNRGLLLNINNDKNYLRKLNSGGMVDQMSLPSMPSFPSKMDISGSQLERLISAVKAQTLNQMDNNSNPSLNVNIKSQFDMEDFVIETDQKKNEMYNRGYDG